MTDQTAQHPAAPETDVSALTDREAHALADAARSTGLSVSGLQLDAIEAEVGHILRERLRVVEGERDAARCEGLASFCCNNPACPVHAHSIDPAELDAARLVGDMAEAEVVALRARAESAEAVIAKVERIVADAEERDRQSLSRTFNGGTFGAYILAADLRALLPGDGR